MGKQLKAKVCSPGMAYILMATGCVKEVTEKNHLQTALLKCLQPAKQSRKSSADKASPNILAFICSNQFIFNAGHIYY